MLSYNQSPHYQCRCTTIVYTSLTESITCHADTKHGNRAMFVVDYVNLERGLLNANWRDRGIVWSIPWMGLNGIVGLMGSSAAQAYPGRSRPISKTCRECSRYVGFERRMGFVDLIRLYYPLRHTCRSWGTLSTSPFQV